MKIYFKGQTIIEFLLAMSLTAIFLPVLLTSLTSSRDGQVQDTMRIDATQLHREAIEAVRSVRERDFNEIATNGTYHPEIQGSSWVLAPDAQTNDGFTQSIEISDVMRDELGAVVETGGSLDPSTKRVDVKVSWVEPRDSILLSTLYLSRFENDVYLETTEADFSAGEPVDTIVTNTAGGEVTLAVGGHGDWCRPSDFIVSQIDLPNSGAARDVKAILGKAYTGTHVGGTGSFVKLNISDTDPPIPSIAHILSGYETNDVFIDQNYAYIATGDISRDVVIIDLNTNTEVGYFNDSYLFGTAKGVWVKDNVGYVTIGFRIHTFDLTSKTGERAELDSISLEPGFFGLLATGYRLQVVGNYAYVAVDFGSSELRLINVTNPQNISLAGYANVNGERGQEVVVNDAGTRAYLATAQSGSKREVFIINTTNKTGSLPIIGSYDSGGMDPKGIALGTENKLLLGGTGGEEYQVIDVQNESNPVRCGGIQVNNGIYGLTSFVEPDNDAYAYIVTGDSTNEFKIIEGGVGGSYGEEGQFTSQTFNAGSDVVFNRLIPNVDMTPETEATFQVAIAKAVSGSCSGVSYSFVGPDGTSGTYYSNTGGSIPLNQDGSGYENPGQCFRYRANLLTNDIASAPVINDVSVNYSP